MDFLFAKNEPFNIASIQQDDGGKHGASTSYWRDGPRTHENECNNDQ
jgi:hypothetical protein